MKKHIGAKVISMLAILTILFVINALISLTAVQNSQKSVQQLSDIYLQLEAQNTTLVELIDQEKLNANIIGMMEEAEGVKKVINSMGDRHIAINDTVTTMQELTVQTGSEELSALLEEYNEEIIKLEETGNRIAKTFLEGNVANAKAINNSIYPKIHKTKAVSEEFTNLLVTKTDELAQEKVGEIKKMLNMVALFSLAYMAVVVLVIVVVLKSIASPARNASKHLRRIIKKIEDNEGDLTERIAVNTQDEVGQLVHGVNSFIEQLQGIMVTIQSESVHMNELVGNITDEINDSNDSASNVSATMEQLSASMEEVAATLDQITAGTQEVLNAAKNMSSKAENGAEFVDTIKNRAVDVKSRAINSKDTTSKMIGDIRQLLEQAIENSRSVQKIDELTGEILNISSQTNLLALNASIEAARAGEAGKGFAVVADEIRVLADNSRDTANNIQGISAMVTKAVEELAKNADDMLRFIDSTVLLDYDNFVEVANQYHDDADNMDSILREFHEGAQSLEMTMANMTDGIDGINTAVDESAQGVTVAAQSTTQLVEALGMIKTEADTNKKISEQLQSEVKRFKNI